MKDFVYFLAFCTVWWGLQSKEMRIYMYTNTMQGDWGGEKVKDSTFNQSISTWKLIN